MTDATPEQIVAFMLGGTMTDIVERLRDLARNYADGVAGMEPQDHFVWDAADEVERLRAALQSMLTDPPATLDEPDTDAEVIIKMREIARRALEQRL